MNTPTKAQIISLLRAWVAQRPGIDARNYISGWNDKDGLRAYRQEVRDVTRDLHDARELLKAVDWRDGITAENLVESFRAFSGRLELKEENGEFRLSYCTGQYWPTEYRKAACSVLSLALWGYWRETMPDERDGDSIRRKARDEFGRGIASRWFN